MTLTAHIARRIIYPHSYPDFIRSGRSEAELLDILKHVHLAYLPAREGGLDTRKEWKDVLSGGEKQRVSVGSAARLGWPFRLTDRFLFLLGTVDGHCAIVLSLAQIWRVGRVHFGRVD